MYNDVSKYMIVNYGKPFGYRKSRIQYTQIKRSFNMATGSFNEGYAIHENIAKMYPSTSDYILVLRYMGHQIGRGFVDYLLVKDKAVEILAECKRLEASEVK